MRAERSGHENGEYPLRRLPPADVGGLNGQKEKALCNDRRWQSLQSALQETSLRFFTFLFCAPCFSSGLELQCQYGDILRQAGKVLLPPPGPVRVRAPLSTATMLHHRLIIPCLSFICKGGGRAVRSLFGGVGFHARHRFMFPAGSQGGELSPPPLWGNLLDYMIKEILGG